MREGGDGELVFTALVAIVTVIVGVHLCTPRCGGRLPTNTAGLVSLLVLEALLVGWM